MKRKFGNKKLYLILAILTALSLVISACGSSSPAPTPTKVPTPMLTTTFECEVLCKATVTNIGVIQAKFRLNELIEEPGLDASNPPKIQPVPTRSNADDLNDRYTVMYNWTRTPTPLPTRAPERKNYRLFINQLRESWTDIAPGETKEFIFSYSFKPLASGKFAIKHLVFVKNANNDGETALEPIEALLTASVPDIKISDARSFTCDEKNLRITIDSAFNAPPWNAVFRDNEKFLEFENKAPSSVTIIWPTPHGTKLLELSGPNFENHKNRLYCLIPSARDDK